MAVPSTTLSITNDELPPIRGHVDKIASMILDHMDLYEESPLRDYFRAISEYPEYVIMKLMAVLFGSTSEPRIRKAFENITGEDGITLYENLPTMSILDPSFGDLSPKLKRSMKMSIKIEITDDDGNPEMIVVRPFLCAAYVKNQVRYGLSTAKSILASFYHCLRVASLKLTQTAMVKRVLKVLDHMNPKNKNFISDIVGSATTMMASVTDVPSDKLGKLQGLLTSDGFVDDAMSIRGSDGQVNVQALAGLMGKFTEIANDDGDDAFDPDAVSESDLMSELR